MDLKLLAITSFLALVMVFSVGPMAMADFSDGSKTYKRQWPISIGDVSGTLEITKNVDRAELKEKTISMKDATDGYDDIVRASLGKAVNDSGKYYLVWKLVSVNYDVESDAKTNNIYVLDAGTGELLTTMTKDNNSCGDKNKSQTTSMRDQI